MLKNIHIQNFRCFEDFKAEGFERINLIGGKNNSGKTCLLEAIFCLRDSNPFEGLRVLRNSISDNDIVNTKSKGEFLSIRCDVPNSNQFFQFCVELDTSNKIGIVTNSSLKDIQFIGQQKEYPPIDILKSVDEFSQLKIKKKIIGILKLVDNRIEDLVTYATKPGLWVVQESKSDEPLSNFGDATKNIIHYFTSIFEKFLKKRSDYKISYLLIDEIENGIHYSSQKDFWRAIFILSKELNVQVFATTHSLEMITAFNEVAKDEGEGAYFEMVRDENNHIEAIKHSTNILEEELDMNVTIRGEVYKDRLSITPKLLASLNNAAKNAQQNLKDNNIAVPYIKDGWIWETLQDGSHRQLEKLEPLNLK